MAAFMDMAAAGLDSSEALPLARTTTVFLTSLAFACARTLPDLKAQGEISTDIDRAAAISSKKGKNANALLCTLAWDSDSQFRFQNFTSTKGVGRQRHRRTSFLLKEQHKPAIVVSGWLRKPQSRRPSACEETSASGAASSALSSARRSPS